ncbi:hypothetical protein C2G38_146302 [Gigaspora rosea]|uniref:Uncharacterized protein n=1 Tax=Gigaspora rosea TaxID=44941 RepID=A0A397UL08_9GLOM|nr:hypothetical protein C2G38_146302 [Gigaspora rosea]
MIIMFVLIKCNGLFNLFTKFSSLFINTTEKALGFFSFRYFILLKINYGLFLFFNYFVCYFINYVLISTFYKFLFSIFISNLVRKIFTSFIIFILPIIFMLRRSIFQI